VTILEACEWLKDTRASVVIREFKWGFAVIEMGHLLALAVLGGALLIVGLRIFGLVLEKHPLDDSLRDLARIIKTSLLVMLISGLLLFLDGPLRYYGNEAFRLKLLLICAAGLIGITVRRFAQSRGSLTEAPLQLKIITMLSLTLWLSAAVAGRVIGVL
jgi:hypothetical protein